MIKNTGNRAIELIKDNSNNILNFNKDKFLLFNNKFNIFNYQNEKKLLYNIIKKYNINEIDFYLVLYNILDVTFKNRKYFISKNIE